jgi:hypothetical protein
MHALVNSQRLCCKCIRNDIFALYCMLCRRALDVTVDAATAEIQQAAVAAAAGTAMPAAVN